MLLGARGSLNCVYNYNYVDSFQSETLVAACIIMEDFLKYFKNL